MATGYDRRQTTRDTFAFQPSAPVQEQARASGQSRGAQVIGGQSQGGMIAAGPQTDAPNIAAGLGAFVEKVMEPHLQRRQQEEFWSGLVGAATGDSNAKLDAGNSPLNAIFGPSSYKEGAATFTALARSSEARTIIARRKDELAAMSQEDASRELGSISQSMMTGNPFVDQIIQADFVQSAPGLVDTVAKARREREQVEALNAWNTAAAKSAEAIQALGSAQAHLSGTGETDNEAMRAGVQSFLGSMVQPDGMSDDAYKKGLYDFMRGAMQGGNFYAVEAMRRSGIDKVFSEEEQVRLEDAYQRYGNRIQGKAMMQFAPRLIELQTRIKFPEGKDGGLTAMEAATELAGINNDLKAATGVDIDLFDYKDLAATAGNVADAVIAGFRRAEERRQQLQDRAQDRAWKLEDEKREEDKTAAQVHALWSMGAVRTGIVGGMKAGDFDALAFNDFRAGNVSNIAHAYAREGWVSGHTAKVMQAHIDASIGQQYTKDFEQGHAEWARLNTASPAAAIAYYGKYHLPMQKFDSLRRGGLSPQIAYVRAFGDPAAYSGQNASSATRKEVRAAVDAAIDASEPYTVFGMGITGTPLNASSKRALATALERRVTAAAANSDVPPEQLAKDNYQALLAAGEAERYGAFAWPTKTGTVPFGQLLHLKPKEAEQVIAGVIDRRLKAVGFSDGVDGDSYEVLRFRDEHNQPVLSVQAFDKDHAVTPVIIPLKEFADERDRARRGEVQGNQPSPQDFAARRAARAGLDPNRHIKGESAAQRLYRINMEEKAHFALGTHAMRLPLPSLGTIARAAKAAADVAMPGVADTTLDATSGVIAAGSALKGFRDRNRARRAAKRAKAKQ